MSCPLRTTLITLCPDFVPKELSGYMVFDTSIVDATTPISELRKCFSCCRSQHLFTESGSKLDDGKTVAESGLRNWDVLQIRGKENLHDWQVRCGSWWWQEHSVGKAWKRWRDHIYHCSNHQAVDRALRHESWKKNELDETSSPLEALVALGGHECRKACAALKRAGGRLVDAKRLLESEPAAAAAQKARLAVKVVPFEPGEMGRQLVQLERDLVAEGKPVMTTMLDMQGEPKAARLFVAVAVIDDGSKEAGTVCGYASWKRMPGHAWSSLQDHCGHARSVVKREATTADEGGAVCEIVNVYVSATYRSRGVGSALLQEALDHCRGVFHAQQILAHAHVDNHAAHAMLYKQGISSSFRRFDFFRRLQAAPY